MLKFDCNNHASSFTREEALVDEFHPLTDDALGIPAGVYTFVYDYPLSRQAKFQHTLVPSMSIIDILLQARADYETIYALEDAAVGKTDHIPGMLNRAQSEGPYGIWGHDFSYLYFESLEVYPETRMVEFGMGS